MPAKTAIKTLSPKNLTTESRKSFYAYVGAVDLAVAKSRELPTEVATKAAANMARTTSFVFELPTKAKGLTGELTTRSTLLTDKATAVYTDLISRGEKLVTSIRGQQSTKAAVAQVKTAKAQAKGAATTASKAAKSVTSRTKAATTSASKAVDATAVAVEDAAAKIG